MAGGGNGLTQMITIVDKSNKVVGSSKQLKDVFAEAKAAYMERKADIKAQRKAREERELQKAIKAMSVVDEGERAAPISRSRTHRHRRRDDAESGHRRRSVDYSVSESPREMPRSSTSLGAYESPRHLSPRSSGGSLAGPVQSQMIRRSKTDVQLQPRRLTRTNSAPDVDLDLAYGEYHDEDLRSFSAFPDDRRLAPQEQQKQLGTLVQKCQGLLDEANCAQFSARKIVTHLQNNPDAMAAVALTLAEISNVASKLAPGALAAFKGSAPAVMALLASPQFLIAVGVGLGVTVVMFGGYKIVKRIKANSGRDSNENLAFGADGQPRSQSMDEMLDVKELDRIESWRRGIADAHTAGVADDGQTVVSGYSAATSVEGEFISPFAAQSMGHLPLPKDTPRTKKEKKDRDHKDSSSHKKRSHKHRDRDAASVTGSEVSHSSSRRGSEREKQVIKVKKPSPLRKMFSGVSVKT